MSDSIRKQITDFLLLRLKGDGETPFPDTLGKVNLSKNRRTAVGSGDLPLYSVYFLNDVPTPVGGDPRRPIRLSRKLLIEVRVIVAGNDDVADPHCQWVTKRVVTADRCILPDDTQLALGITEAQTDFGPIEGTQAEVTETKIRFAVDYTTNPADITKTT